MSRSQPSSSLPFLTIAKKKKEYKFGVQYQREKCHFVVGGDDDDFEDGKLVHWDIYNF